MLEHIGCVGANHLAAFVEHHFFAVRTSFVVAVPRTTVNIDAQSLTRCTVVRSRSKRLPFAVCVI